MHRDRASLTHLALVRLYDQFVPRCELPENLKECLLTLRTGHRILWQKFSLLNFTNALPYSPCCPQSRTAPQKHLFVVNT
jgi:hypothetical protein